MNHELLSVGEKLLAATANAVYPGLILTALVGLALKMARRTNAATRHAVWFVALLLVAALVPAHLWLGPGGFGARAQAERVQPATDLTPSSAGYADLLGTGSEAPEPTDGDLVEPPRGPVGLAVLPVSPSTAPVPKSGSAQPSVHSANAAEVDAAPGASFPGRLREWFFEPIAWVVTPGSIPLRFAGLVFLCVWCLVATLRAVTLFWRLYRLRKLKSEAQPAQGSLAELFRDLCAKLSVRRPVELRLSPVHDSPVVLGFFHPVVLFPSDAARPLGPVEAEHILRHELAHVRRRDDWANLVQQTIQAVLFFHPAVWWVSKQITFEREIACDDYALEPGGRARIYALVLANLAGRLNAHPPRLAPGVTATKSQLQQRINMILNTDRNATTRLATTRLGLLVSAAAFLAALALYSAPRLVLAQTPPAAAAPPASAGAGSSESGPSLAVVSDTPAPNAFSLAHADSPPVGTGPKFKPDSEGESDDGLSLVAPTPPPPPAQPAPAVLSQPRAVILTHPVPPRAPEVALVRPLSPDIEKRLERLERMVEALTSQQGGKPSAGNFYNKEASPWQANRNRDFARRDSGNFYSYSVDSEDMKHAEKEAEKAAKAQQDRGQGAMKEGSLKQIEALCHARDSLQRELENMNRQIERLQAEKDRRQAGQERLQAEQERRQAEQERRAESGEDKRK